MLHPLKRSMVVSSIASLVVRPSHSEKLEGGKGEDKGEGRGKRGAINGNFSLIKEKLHMHLAHTNWNSKKNTSEGNTFL